MNKLKADIAVAIVILLSWIGVGTLSFHHLEEWNWIQSFYFSVVTITTVGYGDLTPTNDASRLFAAIYILIGVSIGVAALGIIGAELIRRGKSRVNKGEARE